MVEGWRMYLREGQKTVKSRYLRNTNSEINYIKSAVFNKGYKRIVSVHSLYFCHS